MIALFRRRRHVGPPDAPMMDGGAACPGDVRLITASAAEIKFPRVFLNAGKEGAPVLVRGRVTGRYLADPPLYDVRLDDGRPFFALQADMVRIMRKPEAVS